MKHKTLGKNFIVNNTLLTLRYKSKIFTTAIFKKRVRDYILTCQFLLNKFDTDFFKECYAALAYIEVNEVLYVARIGGFASIVTPQTVTLNVALVNIQRKEIFDAEHVTPTTFYKEILGDKRFFKQSGKSLEMLISPLGLSRKVHESDQALRRRVLSYLQSQLETAGLDEKIKEMMKRDEGGSSDGE